MAWKNEFLKENRYFETDNGILQQNKIRKIIILLVVCVIFLFSQVSFAYKADSIISASMVSKINGCIEPDMVRVKVIKINPEREKCLVQVLSQTLRNRYIILSKCTLDSEGVDVYGLYCLGQFQVLENRHIRN